MDTSPGYYAVLPACVRYDNRLKPNEKLLFSELSALAQKDGYAWAGNRYFAELYDVSKETVSRWLSNLQSCGYIKVSLDKECGNNRRIIIFDPTENQYLLTKKSIPIDKKVKTPIDEKVKHNNTSINNKKEQEDRPVDSGWGWYTDNQELISALQDFESMRNKIKSPLTTRARKLLSMELDKLSSDDKEKISIVEQSILNNWKGVYAIKSKEEPRRYKEL